MNQILGEKNSFYSTIGRVMSLFTKAYQDIGKDADPLFIEKLSSIVHQVMSARERRYHALDHIFQMANESKGVQVLAILFHDTVYCQVDRRIHPLLMPYLQEFSINEKYECIISTSFEKDALLGLITEIFGFAPGQKLSPNSGQNEYLSAVVAARILQGTLNEWELVQLIAYTEATIPFRLANDKGQTPSDALEQRVRKAVQEYSLTVREKEIFYTIHQAVDVANKDVLGFYSDDLGMFLGQTWQLILEGNPVFKNPLYTVKQYRVAVQKVEGFFNFLNSDAVARTYRNIPTAKDFAQMKEQTKKNLTNGGDYLRAKLVSVCILEALAQLTGGDAPISLLIGEDPKQGDTPLAPVERHLNFDIPVVRDQWNHAAYLVLKFGRASPSSFDFRHSPMSSFVYERMTAASFAKAVEGVKEFSAGKLGAEEFLRLFPKPVVNSIIQSVAEISWSRRGVLMDLGERLGFGSLQSAA